MKGLEIKNMTDTSADLYIYGNILDDVDKNWFWDDLDGFVFPSDIKEQLDNLAGKDLNVYINSVGGNVFAGVVIANMLKRHDGQTTAIVDGLAASIATQPFFVCDKKKMPSNTYLMVHKPWISMSGDADDMIRAAEMLNKIQKGLETTYVENAKEGVTAEQIHEMTNNETWLTGTEAAELFNIELIEPIEAVACVGELPKKFKNMPKSLKFSKENKPQVSPVPPKDKTNRDLENKKIEIIKALSKGVDII